MAEESNDKIYTAADINRYFSGSMLPEERHAIERAALDDPFLAEAMEGYELMLKEDTEKHLAALRKNFEPPEPTAKVIPINKTRSFSWGKAASVILVIGIGSLIWYMTKKQDYNERATTAVIEKTKPLADSINTMAITDSTSSANDIAFQKPALNRKASPRQQIIVADSALTYSPSPQANKSIKPDGINEANDDKDVALENNLLKGKVSGVVINHAAENNIASNQLEKNGFTANNTIVGQVVDNNNKPLAYANIQQPGVKAKQYADANGRFAIKSTDSLAEVVVVGYGTRKRAELTGAASKVVVADANLKAFAKAAKPTILSLDTTGNASPVDGWDKYNLYIANNFILAGKANSGEVELSFTINTDGSTSDFAVDKKSSDAADIEAIRVIQQGPLWKTSSGDKETISVRLRF